MNLRPFIPAISLMALALLALAGVSRKPTDVGSFDIRRAGEISVDLLSCSGQTCQLRAGGETRSVISTEQYTPGPGTATIQRSAGTLSLSNFVPDKIATTLGIVEDAFFAEGMRLVEINGRTYKSDDCQVGQMALSQGFDSATCPKASD